MLSLSIAFSFMQLGNVPNNDILSWAEREPTAKSITDTKGKRVQAEVWQVPQDFIKPRKRTIAERWRLAYWMGNKVKNPTNFSLSCPILSNGEVGYSCHLTGTALNKPSPPEISELAKPVVEQMPVFPRIMPHLAQVRRVEFTLRYDPNDAPKLDLNSGPLVDKGWWGSFLSPRAADYPKKALNRNETATIIAECQVQTDLSVICRTFSVEGTSKPELFAGFVERLLPEAKAPATQTNGESSIGVRVRQSISFAIR